MTPNCTGGVTPPLFPPAATSKAATSYPAEPPVHPTPLAEARALGAPEMAPDGVDRSEGKATPSQPQDIRPLRQGQPDLSVWRGERNPDPDEPF